MGIEALAFCSLLVIVLIVGGLVSLYEALSSSWPLPAPAATTQVSFLCFINGVARYFWLHHRFFGGALYK